MGGWHLGTLVAFDTESTGLDIETARIVTACIAVVDGTGKVAPSIDTWLISPGVPIPPEATKIHGITDEQARRDGIEPREAIARIVSVLAEGMERGYPIVGHNVGPYDLSLLDREARRHGIEPLRDPKPVIDTLVLDKHLHKYRRGKGARKLTALCEAYNARIDGAHDAAFDALASARIAWRMAQQNQVLAAMGLHELHQLQVVAKGKQDIEFAEYLRKQARGISDPNEKCALLDRAAAVADSAGYWPVLPYERQEALR